uniref:Uncharacterized protein n=1 Tax=Sciurus vulgaris TaxID=55149 RepID=A0A8D2DYW1_SCIVU
MQWFTEVMELFLSVWELIKTLNLSFVRVSEHRDRPAGPRELRALLCFPSAAGHPRSALSFLPSHVDTRSQAVPTQSWITSQLLWEGMLAQVLRVGGFCRTQQQGDAVLAQQPGKPLYLL